MLKNFLHLIDIFHVSPALMYKGSYKIKSSLGGLLSIIGFILIWLSIIYFSKDFYQRTNPQTFSKETISSYFSAFNFSDYKFTIAIQNPPIYTNDHKKNVENMTKIFDFNNSYITNNSILVSSYIELYAEYRYFDFSINSYNYKNLKIYNCSFELVGRRDYLCFDFDEVFLGNGAVFRKNSDNFVLIKIEYCKNRTEYSFNCKPQEQILNWVTYMEYLNFLKPDTQIQLDILDNPFLKILSYNMIPMNTHLSSQKCFYFDVGKLDTDKGFIFENIYDTDFIKFSKEDDIYLKKTESNELVSLKITTSNKQIYYKRKFLKLQEVFANLGGIIKFILMVLSATSNFFIDKNYYLRISTELWDEFNKVENVKEVNSFTKNKMISNIKKNKSDEICVNSDRKINELNIHKKKFLDYKIYDYISSMICINKCKSERLKNLEKIYETSKKRIIRRLDVIEIIKYIIEIDRLKFILFDESQLLSLNCLREKKIEFDIDYIKDDIIFENSIISDSYNKLSRNRRGFRGYDNKILSLLEKKLRK